MGKRIYQKPFSDILKFGGGVITDAASSPPPDTLINDGWGGV